MEGKRGTLSISQRVVDIFNEKFGEDIANLTEADDFLVEYNSKKSSLGKAIEESEKQTSNDLLRVMDSCEHMLNELESVSLKIDKLIKQHVHHGEISSPMESDMKNFKKSVQDIQNEQVYVMWVRDINNLSSEVESYIQKKNIRSATLSYDKLRNLSSVLQSTSCKNLKNIANENCEKLFQELKETLSKELNALLTSMQYPFPTGISSPHFNKKEDTEEQFKKILLSLAILKPLFCESKHSLITELITEPLKKRFLFHFYGERHTNNPEKPEWYFTQVLNWIRDHSSFLGDYFQPIINDNQSPSYDLKVEFCEVLVNLAEEKLKDTIDTIRGNDVMLAHLIDETVTFENELHTIVHVPHSVGCLHILLKEDFLELWLKLEENFTFESMNVMLEDEEAWIPKFSELTTTDKNIMYFSPRCVEEFITFLSLMNSRHHSLNDVAAQRKFLNILITSMHHFVTKMKGIASVEVICPESQNYCSILNGAYYMSRVLEEWSEDLYFVELMSPTMVETDIDNDELVDIQEKKVFGDVLVVLDRFISSLVESIVDNLEIGLESKLNIYKSERWHALPSLKEYVTPILSCSACDMMLFIKEHLHLLEEKLCSDIFEKVWKQAALSIDRQIFSQVVFESHFNEGGASQLQFDIKKNLFALFGQYTTRADCYFKLLKDSCTLLNLLPGSAYLMKEGFEQSKSKDDYEELMKNSLNDIGVKHLSSSQASRLINARVDWPKVC